MSIAKLLVSSVVMSGLLSAGTAMAGGDPAPAMAGGDPAHGTELFKKHCAACHNVMKGATPDSYGVVLPLHGIVGRESAQTKGFFYSKAMRESGVVWTEENLNQYMQDPKKMIPGIRMEFLGLENEQDRQDIIAYFLSRQ